MPLLLNSLFGTVDAEQPVFAPLEHFTLEALAYSLHLIPRFNGLGISVLNHSILTAVLVGADTRNHSSIKAALMHDAHEFYLSDLPAPLLRAYPGLAQLDSRGQQALFTHFELDPSHLSFIRPYDKLAMRIELESIYKPEYIPSWFNPAHYPADEQTLLYGRGLLKFLEAMPESFVISVFAGIFRAGISEDLRTQTSDFIRQQ